MSGTEFRGEGRALFRPPEGGLARDDNIFGSSESVMAETENSCHRVRTKGNWDVGRFGRVKFFSMSLEAISCYVRNPSARPSTYDFFSARRTFASRGARVGPRDDILKLQCDPCSFQSTRTPVKQACMYFTAGVNLATSLVSVSV